MPPDTSNPKYFTVIVRTISHNRTAKFIDTVNKTKPDSNKQIHLVGIQYC